MALTKTEVSQLYVSIFGRASEGEGNEYWQSLSDKKTCAEKMLNSDPAKAYFGETLNDNQSFIEFIYENTLNKTIEDDFEGIEYWTKQLNDGKSKGEVITSLLDAIESYSPDGANFDPNDIATQNAYEQFINRVDLSNYVSEVVVVAPEDYSSSLSFDNGLFTTYDDSTITNAMQNIENLITSEEYIEKVNELNKDYNELYSKFNFGSYDYSNFLVADSFDFNNFYSNFDFSDFDYDEEYNLTYDDIEDIVDDYFDEQEDYLDDYEDYFDDYFDDYSSYFDMSYADFNDLDSVISLLSSNENAYAGTAYGEYYGDIKEAIIEYSKTYDIDEYVEDVYEAAEELYSNLGYDGFYLA